MSLALELNEKTKRSIERSTGLSFSEIERMDATDIDQAISEKIGKELKLDLNRTRRPVTGRGSVYLALSRFLKFNVDKKLSKI